MRPKGWKRDPIWIAYYRQVDDERARRALFATQTQAQADMMAARAFVVRDDPDWIPMQNRTQ